MTPPPGDLVAGGASPPSSPSVAVRRPTKLQAAADNAKEKTAERAALCKTIFAPMKKWPVESSRNP